MTAENHQDGDCYKCPYIESCSLIQQNKNRMPNLIQRVQDYYCAVESLRCARRWIYDTLGESFVPPLLLPNQWEWARQIATEMEEESRFSKDAGRAPVENSKPDSESSGRT